MVRRVTEHGMRGQPDCIDHELRIPQTAGGYLLMIPGDAESVREADGEAIAVMESDTVDIEEML